MGRQSSFQYNSILHPTFSSSISMTPPRRVILAPSGNISCYNSESSKTLGLVIMPVAIRRSTRQGPSQRPASQQEEELDTSPTPGLTRIEQEINLQDNEVDIHRPMSLD